MQDCCSGRPQDVCSDGSFVLNASRPAAQRTATVDPCCATGACGAEATLPPAPAFTLAPFQASRAASVIEGPCCATGACALSGPATSIAEPTVVDDCCAGKEHELVALSQMSGVKRVLQVVLAINLTMFFVEFGAGWVAHSTALMADSVDMLGDALVYALSLYALNRSLRWRAGAAVVKGGLIALFGAGVLLEVVLKTLNGVSPTAPLMAAFGAVALAANLSCLMLLYRYRNRDVNLSSTFECSRNDVIANLGVLAAAGGVALLNTGWPDILVGAVIALMFFRSALSVLRVAWPQFRSAPTAVAV